MKLNNYQNTAALTEEERRKMKKAALFKMAAMALLALAVIIFGTIDIPIKQMTAETA